jgi:hypothetical protein
VRPAAAALTDIRWGAHDTPFGRGDRHHRTRRRVLYLSTATTLSNGCMKTGRAHPFSINLLLRKP